MGPNLKHPYDIKEQMQVSIIAIITTMRRGESMTAYRDHQCISQV